VHKRLPLCSWPVIVTKCKDINWLNDLTFFEGGTIREGEREHITGSGTGPDSAVGFRPRGRVPGQG